MAGSFALVVVPVHERTSACISCSPAHTRPGTLQHAYAPDAGAKAELQMRIGNGLIVRLIVQQEQPLSFRVIQCLRRAVIIAGNGHRKFSFLRMAGRDLRNLMCAARTAQPNMRRALCKVNATHRAESVASPHARLDMQLSAHVSDGNTRGDGAQHAANRLPSVISYVKCWHPSPVQCTENWDSSVPKIGTLDE